MGCDYFGSEYGQRKGEDQGLNPGAHQYLEIGKWGRFWPLKMRMLEIDLSLSLKIVTGIV